MQLSNGGANYTSVPTVSFTPPAGASGSGAGALALMGVGSVAVANSPNGSYRNVATPTVTFGAPPCVINTTSCVRATGSAQMSSNNLANLNRRVTGVNVSNRGSGYTAAPGISFSTGPASASARLAVMSVALQSGGAGYDAAPLVAFAEAAGAVPRRAQACRWERAARSSSRRLATRSCRTRPIPGPTRRPRRTTRRRSRATTALAPPRARCTVTIGGLNAAMSSWSDTAITVHVPPALPNCALAQRGVAAATALVR